MASIEAHNLGSAWFCRRWRVLSYHRAYRSRPGSLTIFTVPAVPADDVLHDAWWARGARGPFRYRFFGAVRQQCALVLVPGVSEPVCVRADGVAKALGA